MATLSEQLQAIRQLKENWDGHGATPPRGKAIEIAEAFTKLLEALLPHISGGCKLRVRPNREGGVLIKWEDTLKKHEAEISRDGSMSFLHLTRATKQIESRKFLAIRPAVMDPGVLHELRSLLTN
jgi:hypothetical protein